MADNDKSKIRYDDFVSSVQPDPAKPESTIMLSGFVGHGPEGHARVYPDPTLGTWYDIPEDDIVHSMPIADSKLGGSYVWVRTSSQIKPGSAAPQPAEAAQGGQAAQAGQAVGINPTPATHCFVCDPPKAAAGLQPTPTVQTHCFICPPHTQAIHCPTAPVVCDTIVPTPRTQCIHCPPHNTAATVCTMPPGCPPSHAIHCPTSPVICDTMLPTPATRCFICPPVDQTLATVCTQIACPTHQIHCPTQPVVCNLQPTQPMVCGVFPPTFNCTPGCQQQGGGQQQLPQAQGMMAAVHPTPSAVHQCGQPNTAATICTQVPHCPPPHTVHHTMCICPTPSAVHHCGPNTAATVCTQVPHCPPPHTVHHTMCICPTPSAVQQCGGQTPFTPTIPQVTLVGACPTFGVCPSIACGFTPVQNGVFTPFGR